jgi:hypothetical protein
MPVGDHSSPLNGDCVANLVKVIVPLERSDWHDHTTESMWATPLTDGLLRLENVPFYAYGLSFGDSVQAIMKGTEREFATVIQRGGHSTYRIFVTAAQPLERFHELCEPLLAMGCTLERATERLFAVDVPPAADIRSVYRRLEHGQKAGLWDFDEGHVGHAV